MQGLTEKCSLKKTDAKFIKNSEKYFIKFYLKSCKRVHLKSCCSSTAHCVKNVRIPTEYSVRMRKNTDQKTVTNIELC